MGAVVKVVILAGSVNEGWGHARLAGLSRNDTIIPGSAQGARGLDLDYIDLIVELPSFARHPHHDEIEAEVRRAVEAAPKFKGGPIWHKAGEGEA